MKFLFAFDPKLQYHRLSIQTQFATDLTHPHTYGSVLSNHTLGR